MYPFYKKARKYVLESGCDASLSVQENKKIKLVNAISILSGILLTINIIWLHFLGVPLKILYIFLPTVSSLLLLFLVSRFISTNIAKFGLIILINCTILLGGLISDNTPSLQQVLSTWIFSTAGMLILIFDLTEWGKILTGCFIILTCHILIGPVDRMLVSAYSPNILNSNIFVTVSFVFSMSLLIGAIYFAQKNDLKIYVHLVKDLQVNNEKLRTQEEELRQSYEELRASREQIFIALETVNEKKGHLEVAMRIAKMGSYHFYFQTDQSDWSEEMKNLMELEGIERARASYNLFDFVHPDDRNMVRNEIELSKRNLEHYNLVYRVITAKGNTKTILSAGYVFRDPYHNTRGIRGIVQDISDYKKIENELTEANKELENFIYRAYHDIKGPLATIKGICYIASLTSREEQSATYFKLLKQHTYQLEAILSKLLIINELKGLSPHIEHVNLHVLVAEVTASVKNINKTELVQLQSEINAPYIVHADKIFLKLILQNLLENAYEYRGEVMPSIKISAYLEPEHLVLAVSDNGLGIPEEYYDKIFERYFRVSEKSKGNGLGLYIVKKLADKLGASITVRSTPHIDTTFLLKVPLKN